MTNDESLTLPEVITRAEQIHTKFGIPVTEADYAYLNDQYQHIIAAGRKVSIHWVEFFYAKSVLRRTDAYRDKIQAYRNAYAKLCKLWAEAQNTDMPSFEATYYPKLEVFIKQHITCPCSFCVNGE